MLHVFTACVRVRWLTCGSSLQAWAKSRHHAWVSDLTWFSHTDLKGAARNVATIEAYINGVDAVLTWDEADRVLVCSQETQSVQKQNDKDI